MKKRIILCAAVVGAVAWAASDSVLAQSARKIVPDEPLVGPAKPTARPAPARRGAAGPSKGRAIPGPTVELKPGEIPKIQFDMPVWDFGRIRAGSDVEHEFWFTNIGTGPREILRVKPS